MLLTTRTRKTLKDNLIKEKINFYACKNESKRIFMIKNNKIVSVNDDD